MRKKYSFLREQFRDLTWQKTVYDKIIAILNKSIKKHSYFIPTYDENETIIPLLIGIFYFYKVPYLCSITLKKYQR